MIFLLGKMPNYSNNTTQIYWVKDFGNYYQSNALVNTGYNYGGYQSFGNYPSGTYGTFTAKVQSINGGDVTIVASSQSDSRYYAIDYIWYAIIDD